MDILSFSLLIFTLIIIGIRKAKRVQKEETYLFADRSSSWLSLSSTLVMTELNPSTLISFASLGYLAGYRALLLPLVFLIGLLFYAITVAKKYKQLDASSVCFLFREKYGKNLSQIACLFLILAMLGFTATYVKSLSMIFSPLVPQLETWILSAICVGITLLMTLRGGFVSINKTDRFSFFLTLILIPFLFFLADRTTPPLSIQDFTGDDQILNSSFVFSLILLTMFTYILAPWYGQKIFSARSDKVAFSSVIFSAFCIFVLYGLIVLSAAFYRSSVTIESAEQILPFLIQQTPIGWKGAFYAFLFLAGATTLSGIWNAMTSLFLAEFQAGIKGEGIQRSYWITLGFSLLSYLLAHLFVDSVFDKMILANIPVLALSFSLLAGFYWKGVRPTGAYLSTFLGFFWGVFCYTYWGGDRIYISYWVMGGIPLIFLSGIFGSVWETRKVKWAKQEETAKKSEEWIYRGKTVDLKKETFHFEDKSRDFEIVVHPGAVVMIPIDKDGDIILVRQYRRAVGEIILELPAGTIEPGENPLPCAQRELQEEIGYRSEKITPLHGFYTAPGFCSEYLYLYLAQELIPSELDADEDEMIDVVSLSLQECWEKIQKGEIRDAKTISGILLYERMRK